MLTIQARLSTVEGKGVGRWRKYYEADDLRDARRAARSLVQSAQVRVMNGRDVVVTPRRASEFVAEGLYRVSVFRGLPDGSSVGLAVWERFGEDPAAVAASALSNAKREWPNHAETLEVIVNREIAAMREL